MTVDHSTAAPFLDITVHLLGHFLSLEFDIRTVEMFGIDPCNRTAVDVHVVQEQNVWQVRVAGGKIISADAADQGIDDISVDAGMIANLAAHHLACGKISPLPPLYLADPPLGPKKKVPALFTRPPLPPPVMPLLRSTPF